MIGVKQSENKSKRKRKYRLVNVSILVRLNKEMIENTMQSWVVVVKSLSTTLLRVEQLEDRLLRYGTTQTMTMTALDLHTIESVELIVLRRRVRHR